MSLVYDDHSYCAGGHCTDCWCLKVWVNDDPGITCGVDHDAGPHTPNCKDARGCPQPGRCAAIEIVCPLRGEKNACHPDRGGVR